MALPPTMLGVSRVAIRAVLSEYRFVDPDPLFENFQSDIDRWNYENSRS